MGKVEDMRAMKQQRRAALEASAGAPPARAAAAARTPAPVRPPAATPAAQPGPPAPDGQLCGHRSIGSRTCTRPAGHAEKNHRYAPAERPTG